ncbi:MAG: CRISPR-associated endonuclease Cas1 [Anaerolineae bacterium]|nr:CRISPR-associated endonuclease Cas1 [Anaerolineae bacterium]
MNQLIVDTQGAQLRQTGEQLIVQRGEETLQTVPLGPLQQVILMGRGVSATTPLLYDLVRRGIDVIYQSQRGRFGFRLVGPDSKHSALRVAQVQAAANPAHALALARATVAGKLHNQAVILRRYGAADQGRGQAALQTIGTQIGQARQAANLDALRGHEGSGAAAYFAAWPILFDAQRWGFEGRAYYPPPDPVNAMLSFGYTLLLNDMTGALHRIGLDPAIGFFHTIDYGRPSLALDLEEEFRPIIVDTMVLSLLRQDMLRPSDFTRSEDGRRPAIMTDDARRFFIARYEERMALRVHHPAWEQSLSFRQCIERQVQHMARCIQGRDTAYQPLMLK